MRNVLLGVGLLLLLVGIVWIGQGLNIIKGSFMTGQAFWGWVGLICALAGLAAIYTGVRDRLRR
jgi:hypothetical protein